MASHEEKQQQYVQDFDNWCIFYENVDEDDIQDAKEEDHWYIKKMKAPRLSQKEWYSEVVWFGDPKVYDWPLKDLLKGYGSWVANKIMERMQHWPVRVQAKLLPVVQPYVLENVQDDEGEFPIWR